MFLGGVHVSIVVGCVLVQLLLSFVEEMIVAGKPLSVIAFFIGWFCTVEKESDDFLLLEEFRDFF